MELVRYVFKYLYVIGYSTSDIDTQLLVIGKCHHLTLMLLVANLANTK